MKLAALLLLACVAAWSTTADAKLKEGDCEGERS